MAFAREISTLAWLVAQSSGLVDGTEVLLRCEPICLSAAWFAEYFKRCYSPVRLGREKINRWARSLHSLSACAALCCQAVLDKPPWVTEQGETKLQRIIGLLSRLSREGLDARWSGDGTRQPGGGQQLTQAQRDRLPCE